MGIVRMGPPAELLESLAATHGIGTFVETGTYQGGTAEWASDRFENVYTVEASPELFEQTRKRLRDRGNISFLHGDSRRCLAEIIPNLRGPTMFWLDAHWGGPGTAGESDPCPLLDEIKLINTAAVDCFLFIDDARFFLSPPSAPNKPDQWPDIALVLDALRQRTDPYVVILEDVLMAVPKHAKPDVVAYCQSVNMRLWQEYLWRYHTPPWRKGIRLMRVSLSRGARRCLELMRGRRPVG